MDANQQTRPDHYQHTQIGWPLIIIFVPLLAFTGIWMLATDFLWPTVAAGLLLAASLVTFVTMTVSVDQVRIEIRFGPGLVRTTFPLDRIYGLCIVRNPPWTGWGIHWLSYWIFNVSGSEAVEIEMRNGNCIRIGSDEPEELARAIEKALISLQKK